MDVAWTASNLLKKDFHLWERGNRPCVMRLGCFVGTLGGAPFCTFVPLLAPSLDDLIVTERILNPGCSGTNGELFIKLPVKRSSKLDVIYDVIRWKVDMKSRSFYLFMIYLDWKMTPLFHVIHALIHFKEGLEYLLTPFWSPLFSPLWRASPIYSCKSAKHWLNLVCAKQLQRHLEPLWLFSKHRLLVLLLESTLWLSISPWQRH